MKKAILGFTMELICVEVRILMILVCLLMFGKLHEEENDG